VASRGGVCRAGRRAAGAAPGRGGSRERSRNQRRDPVDCAGRGGSDSPGRRAAEGAGNAKGNSDSHPVLGGLPGGGRTAGGAEGHRRRGHLLGQGEDALQQRHRARGGDHAEPELVGFREQGPGHGLRRRCDPRLDGQPGNDAHLGGPGQSAPCWNFRATPAAGAKPTADNWWAWPGSRFFSVSWSHPAARYSNAGPGQIKREKTKDGRFLHLSFPVEPKLVESLAAGVASGLVLTDDKGQVRESYSLIGPAYPIATTPRRMRGSSRRTFTNPRTVRGWRCSATGSTRPRRRHRRS